MEDSDITVRFTAVLVTPDRVAVILVVPSATAVAKPVEEIVAVPVVSLLHITLELMFAVEPSE